MVRALTNAGVPSTLRFNPVGEIGRDLIKILSDTDRRALGGEGVLRIDNR
jgi:mediator of RNA polymerase II transcription subunit 17